MFRCLFGDIEKSELRGRRFKNRATVGRRPCSSNAHRPLQAELPLVSRNNNYPVHYPVGCHFDIEGHFTCVLSFEPYFNALHDELSLGK